MKKVLVAGAAGFIGHHAVEHFLKTTDWFIYALDALNYASDNRRLEETGLVPNERTKFVYWDLQNPIPTALANTLGQIDYVFNFASQSHVDLSIAKPVPFLLNNLYLMMTVLEYARKHKPRKLIHISTDEVYGPAELGVRHRESDPHRPSNPYAASKAAQENLAHAYWRTYGIDTVVVNSMNVFGERQHPEKFLPKIIKHVLSGEKLPIHASVSCGMVPGSRCWVYAKDFADALKFVADEPTKSDTEFPKFHVAGAEWNNLEFAQMVADILGKPLSYELVDCETARPGHDARYALSDYKIKARGWNPPFGWNDAIKKTVQFYADHPEWLEPKP